MVVKNFSSLVSALEQVIEELSPVYKGELKVATQKSSPARPHGRQPNPSYLITETIEDSFFGLGILPHDREIPILQVDIYDDGPSPLMATTYFFGRRVEKADQILMGVAGEWAMDYVSRIANQNRRTTNIKALYRPPTGN